jgi:hypothetical protein
VRIRRAALLAPSVVVALAVLGLEGRSWLLFHTLTPWSTPPRIHYCGHNYLPAGSVPAPIGTRISSGPLWQPIYGERTGTRSSGAPCAMVLYLGTHRSYREYVLSGGP